MATVEITLEAAIRDAGSPTDNARNIAVRNLATALLAEIGEPGPRWRAADKHERGEVVLETLRHVARHDPLAPIRGLAIIGLGRLGDPSTIEESATWIALDGDAEDDAFLRECAVIAMSFVAAAAPDTTEGNEARQRVLEQMRVALHSARNEVRFQAAVAMAEIGGSEVEKELVEALRSERNTQVREGLVDALSTFDPPGREACDVLQQIVDGEEGDYAIGFRAAVTLAAARRAGGAKRLIRGLVERPHRDDALEALAALGMLAPAEALPPLRKLARSWLTPAITRVRAAYALARLSPDEGLPLLDRLGRHLRPAVREAVADARRGLTTLENLDRSRCP
jgi:HEAT repeat protein